MSSRPKTLVILTPAFPTLEEQTWLPSQADFVKTLNRVYPKLRIVILAFHFPVVPAGAHDWYGNKVIAFNGSMKGRVRTLILWRRVWRELKRLRTSHDLIGMFSFFCSESAFVGHHFARKYGLRHYIWILGQDARPGNNQVKRIRPESSELIAISDFLVREFEQSHGIRPSHMIPIGIDPEAYSLKAGRTIDIIGVGGLSAIKQYDQLIWVVQQLSQSLPSLVAILCGDGEERQALQLQIDEAGLQDILKLTGRKDHHEVLDLMQQSRVLLHPSSYEGFGMVCAEALAAGAHVISFCKPLDLHVDHWHIVSNKEEMAAKALELLSSDSTKHSAVVPHHIVDSATRLMNLFGYEEADR